MLLSTREPPWVRPRAGKPVLLCHHGLHFLLSFCAIVQVSLFFCDIVGYTDICSMLEPQQILDMLHRLYSRFDALAEDMDLFKGVRGEPGPPGPERRKRGRC